MPPKRMISVRLPEATVAAIDAAAGTGTRTDWITDRLTRAALTAAGRPQPVKNPGGKP